MRGLISFVVGFIFAIGLGLSGMTQTHIVKGFLDIFGNWNINLLGVMVGAIVVHSIAYFIVRKKESPLLDSKFHIPTRKDIDKRLIAGAAIFGLGWGWAGICPGPGIVSLVHFDAGILIFIFTMLIGMYTFKFFEKKFL